MNSPGKSFRAWLHPDAPLQWCGETCNARFARGLQTVRDGNTECDVQNLHFRPRYLATMMPRMFRPEMHLAPLASLDFFLSRAKALQCRGRHHHELVPHYLGLRFPNVIGCLSASALLLTGIGSCINSARGRSPRGQNRCAKICTVAASMVFSGCHMPNFSSVDPCTCQTSRISF